MHLNCFLSPLHTFIPFIIEECFSKTHSVHFNPFWDNHDFVFIAIYKFFDFYATIRILNSYTLRNDSLYIKKEEEEGKNKV